METLANIQSDLRALADVIEEAGEDQDLSMGTWGPSALRRLAVRLDDHITPGIPPVESSYTPALSVEGGTGGVE